MATATIEHEIASDSFDPDVITSVFIKAVPDMDAAKQRLMIALYQSLARGMKGGQRSRHKAWSITISYLKRLKPKVTARP